MSASFVPPPTVAELGPLPAQLACERARREHNIGWSGTAQDALDQARPIAEQGQLDGNYWHPARVARAVIDYATGESRIELVNEAMRLNLEIFAGFPCGDRLARIGEALANLRLLGRTVLQQEDDVTQDASLSAYSLVSANRISQKTGTEPLLFIPVCHGGLPAGTQTVLKLAQINPHADIAIYPVRYSTDKYKDKIPLLTEEEKEYLQEIGSGRTVVIFDEDASQGHSLRDMATAIRALLPQNKVLGRVNVDHRYKEYAQEQGAWWEHPYVPPTGWKRFTTRIKSIFV